VAAEGAPTAPTSRLPVLVGAGVAAILVMLVVSRVLSGGAGDDEAPSPTTSAPPAAAMPAPTAAPTSPAPEPVESFEVFTTKNPFTPLRAAASASTATPPVGRPSSGSAPAPVVPSGTGATEPVGGARMALLDVFAEEGRTMANVKVNDTVHKVAAGDAFAGGFKVISLSKGDGCGRFLFGDDRFRLCEGEVTRK